MPPMRLTGTHLWLDGVEYRAVPGGFMQPAEKVKHRAVSMPVIAVLTLAAMGLKAQAWTPQPVLPRHHINEPWRERRRTPRRKRR